MLYGKDDHSSIDEEHADGKAAYAHLIVLPVTIGISIVLQNWRQSACLFEVVMIRKRPKRLSSCRRIFGCQCFVQWQSVLDLLKYVACRALFQRPNNIVSGTTDMISQPCLRSGDDQLVVPYIWVVTALKVRNWWGSKVCLQPNFLDVQLQISANHFTLSFILFWKPQRTELDKEKSTTMS